MRHKGKGFLKLKATVDKNHKGFAFLSFETKNYEDAFVPPRKASLLFHGDRVEVTINSRGEVLHLTVIEHRFKELYGRFIPHLSNKGGRSGWVVYERKKAREEVFVPKGYVGAKSGDWVRAKLHFHEKGPFPVTAEILEAFGATFPSSADVGMIAAEYNLMEAHPSTAEREAQLLKLEIPKNRTDLRHIPFITIDGENARDFDDAIFVEHKKSGYVLWVAIADVSHYVHEGSALDSEAKARGTSVYFPERAFHMLPRALSENLCSLRPHEPRLAMVAEIELDRLGKRVQTRIVEAVIESRRRATYTEIQSEWLVHQNDSKWEYRPHFELYKILRKARSDRGSIDFDLPEAEVLVDQIGEPISILNRERLDSHRLIEEFMIAANEAVTEWMMKRNWPFIYRIHEEPSAQSLEKFRSLAASIGMNLTLSKESSPLVLSDLIRRFEGHPAQELLNMALLRSMKQAIYSAAHGIHYGLASEGYTHFTSPIRRYPDLIVLRLIHQVLLIENKQKAIPKKSSLEKLQTELEKICEHTSYRERLAADAERESIRIKQVRLMKKHLGDEFEGKVIGMVNAGLFIQISSPYVEGLLPKEALSDDFYEFDEDRMLFRGRKKKRMFRIGDKIKIQVVRADLDRRQIDFGWVRNGMDSNR